MNKQEKLYFDTNCELYDKDDSYDSEKLIKLKLRVMHDSVNPNGSNFELDAINDAESSIYGIPILAKVKFGENGQPQFMSHEMHLEIDYKDDLRVIYDEIPIGFIPNDAFYEVKKYNDKNYVYVDCYIWRGYSNYAEDIIERDKDVKLSMEIVVDKYEFDKTKDYLDVKKYRYTGITLLGTDVGTGMLDALATTETEKANFSIENIKEKATELINQLKFDFQIKNSQKGGNIPLMNNELIQSILAEYELTLEQLNFDVVEEMTEEEFRLKLNELQNTNDNSQPSPETTFSATYRQKREVLSNLLPNKIEKDSEGNIIKEVYCWLADFDDNYIYVERNTWTKDNYDCDNGRYSYTFDDANLSAELTGEFEEMIVTWVTIEENKALQEMRSNYELAEKELTELRQFKIEMSQTQKDEIFSKFDEQLSEVEDYKKLKKNCVELSSEELEDKCFCLVGKLTSNFSANKKEKPVIKIPFELHNDNDDNDVDDGYGGLLVKEYKN